MVGCYLISFRMRRWRLESRSDVAWGARCGTVFSGVRVKKVAFLAEIGLKTPFFILFLIHRLQNFTECEILCEDSIYEGAKSRCILT